MRILELLCTFLVGVQAVVAGAIGVYVLRTRRRMRRLLGRRGGYVTTTATGSTTPTIPMLKKPRV